MDRKYEDIDKAMSKEISREILMDEVLSRKTRSNFMICLRCGKNRRHSELWCSHCGEKFSYHPGTLLDTIRIAYPLFEGGSIKAHDYGKLSYLYAISERTLKEEEITLDIWERYVKKLI